MYEFVNLKEKDLIKIFSVEKKIITTQLKKLYERYYKILGIIIHF